VGFFDAQIKLIWDEVKRRYAARSSTTEDGRAEA
jgi:hypothetical protein